MVSFFGFGQSADIAIRLSDENTRKKASIRNEDGNIEEMFLYFDGEPVSGEISITLKKANQKLEHNGIRVDFIGQIEAYYDRGNTYDFVSLSKELARPGEILENNTKFPFYFGNVSKSFESYIGCNVKLRYFVRVTIKRRLTDIVKEHDILVHSLSTYPDTDVNLKMEVGIEDCLHIEFEYNRSRYHLKDVIVGKIYFLLVRIKIKYMEIAIIKRESVGTGSNTYNENETIAKYEIMDGAPVKGETIPIRLFLSGYDLGPTMREICKRFSVRYFLNLVLIDEEDRRYFKQQEITLFRKAELPLRNHNLSEQLRGTTANFVSANNTAAVSPDTQQQSGEGGEDEDGGEVTTPEDDPPQVIIAQHENEIISTPVTPEDEEQPDDDDDDNEKATIITVETTKNTTNVAAENEASSSAAEVDASSPATIAT